MLSSGWGCLQVPAFPETGKSVTNTPGSTLIGKRETSISDSPVPVGFCHCLPRPPHPPLKPACVSHLYHSVNVSPLPGNLNSGHRVRLGVRQIQHSARYKVHVGGNRQTSDVEEALGPALRHLSSCLVPALSPLSVDWPPILCCTVQTCSGACPVASLTTLALPGQGPPTKPPHASQQSVGRPPSGAVPAAPGNGCLQTPNSLA